VTFSDAILFQATHRVFSEGSECFKWSFCTDAKSYETEAILFDTASYAPSYGCRNGYASEDDVFSFYPTTDRFENNSQILLGKVMSQGHFTAMQL
jgi:hypothetical protein